ncbi:MAG TPA: glycosyl hydrolase family protein [Chloroflexi bacterium]|nr:glycosyl hydrolase family protein [Chloroflexota bacterium]
MNTVYKFPDGFLWGTATAAHQVEGNNYNSDGWLMEHLTHSLYLEPSGDAVDHYHRYQDDIRLLAELGFNSYRFSIEWARVEPEREFFSQAILDHYKRMLEACHQNQLVPMMTLHHFTSPRWLIHEGGWGSFETAARFGEYAGLVMRELGDLAGAVCTINEVNIPTMARMLWMRHMDEEGDNDEDGDSFYRMALAEAATRFRVPIEKLKPFMLATSEHDREVMLNAHQQAALACKAEHPDVPVGMTLAMADMQAEPGGELIRDEYRHELQDIFLDAAREGGDDFIGVQTYTRERYGPEGLLPVREGAPVTQMGYENYPKALEGTIRYAAAKSGLPVYVTENGIGTSLDSERLAYYRTALQGVVACMRDGIDVRGYYAWSAFDNFEWNSGYEKTFGIISVDRETQKRKVKTSGFWLGDVAKANQYPID